MVSLKFGGRLGNNLIQFAAAAVLAKKHNLCLNLPTYKPLAVEFFKRLDVKSISGTSYQKQIEVNDKNYFNHLEMPVRETGFCLKGYFQDGRLLCEHRVDILNLYKLPSIDCNPSSCDAFLACRLGDTLLKQHLIGKYSSMEYIENQLKKHRKNYGKVYVTSDTINHLPLAELIKRYDLTIYQNEPLDTILFASQFNNLILSAGTFSYWMAYFSQAENITVYKSWEPLQRNNAWEYNQKVNFSN